jgi:hypothetical protein
MHSDDAPYDSEGPTYEEQFLQLIQNSREYLSDSDLALLPGEEIDPLASIPDLPDVLNNDDYLPTILSDLPDPEDEDDPSMDVDDPSMDVDDPSMDVDDPTNTLEIIAGRRYVIKRPMRS